MKLTTKTLIICILVAIAETSQAQRLRLLADVELIGEGLVDQTINYGHYTSTESLTGMSSVNLGLNVQLPYRFECSLIGGSLFKIGFNTTYSTGSNSSSSMSFSIPKVGLEMSRSFIWDEDKFASGLNFGFGVERYWPQTFSATVDNEDITINYKSTTGYYFRAKLVFREGKRFQLEPNLTYRSFNLVASNYFKSEPTEPLDASMLNLQVRNISVGVVAYLGFSPKK